MRALLLAVVACNAPRVPPSNHPPVQPDIAPTDEQLGVLAVVPVASHTPGSWIPVLDPNDHVAAFVPEPWAGPAYGDRRFPPKPRVTDARGVAITGSYGDLNMLRDYGCGRPHGLVPIQATTPLQPGVAWVLPGNTTWRPRPAEIQTTSSSADHREHAIGPVTVEVTRTSVSHAITAFAWRGRKLLELELERSEDETEPLDLLDSNQVPQLEAAWSIGGAIVIVTREHRGDYRTTFRAVLVTPTSGREAKGMISVLCYAS